MSLLLKGLRWWSGDREGLGDLRLRRGRILEVDRGLANRNGERLLRLDGLLALPGLINCHDHLGLDLLPPMGRPPYSNFYQWAREIYRPGEPPVRDWLKVRLRDRLLWGGLRNLISGVSTVVHHDPYHRRWFGRGFPVRVLSRYGWSHSLGYGTDPQRAHRRSRGRPFLIHLAEGTDDLAAGEIERAEEMGLLDDRTVLVHGIAIDPKRHGRVFDAGCSLIWCPSSNLHLYGRTAPVDSLRDRMPIGLGTDSTLSGSATLLDELRTAASTGLAPAAELLAMVTTGAARIFRLTDGRGRLLPGGPGDVLVVRDQEATPAGSLLATTPADIELLTIAGEPRLASPAVAEALDLGSANTLVSGSPKWLSRPLDRLRQRTREAAGADFVSASRVWSILEPLPSGAAASSSRRQQRMPSVTEIGRRQLSLLTHRIRALPVLVLMPHSSCNCRCVMCDIWKANRDRREVSAEDLSRHLPSLSRLGVKQVVLSGGEPLMHSNLWRLCALLGELGITVTLLSTGLLLRRHAREIVRSCDEVIVSLDGSPAVHDGIRDVPRAFARLADGVLALRELQPSYRVTGRCVVQRANYRDLPRVIETAKEMGLSQISFLAADVFSQAFNRPAPWTEDRVAEVALGNDEASELLDVIEKILVTFAAEFESRFIAESPEKMLAIARYFQALNGDGDFPVNRCNAPWVSTVVEADGTVRPCFFHPPLGNISERPLEEILNSRRAIAFRRELDIATDPVCRKCVCTLNLAPWSRTAATS